MEGEEKTALVLSAGGMFGAYQAGVWQTLSDRFRPDIVVGASVGSLNGWLIASGCPGDELVNRWLALDAMSELRWRVPRSLADGVLDASRLVDTIQEMCGSCTPTVEFGVVLTELRRMKPRLFQWPDIGWQHIAASCSVPLILPHYMIDGVLYSDGGLVDPLPLWAALEMGATRIVAVNLLKLRSPLIRTMVKTVQSWGRYERPETKEIVLVEVSPEQTLGSAWDSMRWTRDNAGRWIEQGRRDCESAMSAIVEYGIRQGIESFPGENKSGCTFTGFTA